LTATYSTANIAAGARDERMKLSTALLVILAFCSLVAVLVFYEKPVLADALCRQVVCPGWGLHQRWGKLFYDLGLTSLTSLIFYWILVVVPENQRRERLRRSMTQNYRLFREDVVSTLLGIIQRSYSVGQVRELATSQRAFRDFFHSPSDAEGQEWWHAVQNRIREHHIASLTIALELFRDEIAFLLNNADVRDDEAFAFFRRLSDAITSAKVPNATDSPADAILGFIWQALSGWNAVSGYPEHDVIADMIRKI
jgi:hypothetical protein